MFGIFDNKETGDLKTRAEKLEKELEALRVERLDLKDEVGDLKLKKKVEEEDIKHMVMMKEERLDLKHLKKTAELEAEYATKNAGAELEKQKAIGEVKDKYRDKAEAVLEKQVNDMKDMYGQILERLPNVAVKLKG